LRPDKPTIFLVNSSFSKEDRYDFLFSFCSRYESDEENKEKMIIILSGKGPLRDYWISKFGEIP